MKCIIRPRQLGKTTELIKLASKGRYKLIVCHNQNEARRIFKLARNMDLNIPLPISYREFLDKSYCGNNIEAFLIDNVDLFLGYLTEVPIEVITITEEDKNGKEELSCM